MKTFTLTLAYFYHLAIFMQVWEYGEGHLLIIAFTVGYAKLIDILDNERNIYKTTKKKTETEKKKPEKPKKKAFEGIKLFSDEVVEVVIISNSDGREWLQDREGEVLKVRKGINNNFFQTVDYVMPFCFGLVPFKDVGSL